MTRFFATLLAASFALTAVAAMAESTVSESRARLAAAWERDGADAAVATERQPAATERGPVATMRQPVRGHWAGNWRGGRKHPPAGR